MDLGLLNLEITTKTEKGFDFGVNMNLLYFLVVELFDDTLFTIVTLSASD